jgi:acyl carrier protein
VDLAEQVRKILASEGRLAVDVAEIAPDDDLYKLGLTSHASVTLMLALEDAFEVEFPDNMLNKRTFESIRAITEGLETLGAS